MSDCLVAIVWATNVEEGTYGFLTYGSHGEVRVYHRDHYDARCDLDRDRQKDGPLPFFRNWEHARRFFLAHPPRTMCQIMTTALRRPFRDLELAAVDAPRPCDAGFEDTHNRGEA